MWVSLRGIFRSPGFKPVLMVIGISLIMILLPASVRVTISRISSYSFLYPFVGVDKFLTKIEITSDENKSLNRDVEELKRKVSGLIEDRYENDRLRKMLGFDIKLPYKVIPTEVIAIDPNSPFQSILINAGKKDMVTANMPVISPEGVIGKTVSSDNHASVVQLLYDPSCKIAARVQNSRVQGIIASDSKSSVKLTNVPLDQPVAKGDSVISSGLGGIFPPGLFIGIVSDVGYKEGELFRDIKVTPGANFSTIEELFIIISGQGEN